MRAQDSESWEEEEGMQQIWGQTEPQRAALG